MPLYWWNNGICLMKCGGARTAHIADQHKKISSTKLSLKPQENGTGGQMNWISVDEPLLDPPKEEA
jgi:hypothetical protein